MSRQGYSSALKGAGSVKTLIVNFAGLTLLAFAAQTRKLIMPESGKVIGVSVHAAAKGGTHSTSTADVKSGSTSLLGALFDVAGMTAGTSLNKEVADLSAAAASVAKDAVLSVVLAESGGSSPTISGFDVQIDYVPLGD